MVLFVCWYAPVFCSHHWFFSYNCYYDYYIQWLLFFKFWLDKLSFFLLFLSFSCFQNNFVIYIIGSPVFWHSRTNPVIYIYYSITNGYLLSLSLSYPVLPSCIPSSIRISDSQIKYLGHILRHPDSPESHIMFNPSFSLRTISSPFRRGAPRAHWPEIAEAAIVSKFSVNPLPF